MCSSPAVSRSNLPHLLHVFQCAEPLADPIDDGIEALAIKLPGAAAFYVRCLGTRWGDRFLLSGRDLQPRRSTAGGSGVFGAGSQDGHQPSQSGL